MKSINVTTFLISATIVLSGCSMLSSKSAEEDNAIPKTVVIIPEIRLPFEKGDTLWEFAERTTGSGYNWKQLKIVNRIEDENKIDAGVMLLVPNELALEELKNQ